MEGDKPAMRRRHSAAVKAQVMAECDAPGASVAKVAMAHGINANVVHRWRQLARQARVVPVHPSGFVQLALPAPSAVAVTGELRIQLQRGGTSVTVIWPLGAAAESAAWLREILR